jgi:hypothetical protein
MALTCDPRTCERKQEDHEFETSLGYTVTLNGRKERRKEGRKERRKEGRRKEGRNYLSCLASLLMVKLQNLSKGSSF